MLIDLFHGFHLTPVREGDQDAFVEHFRDKETTDRLLKVPYPYTREDAESWVRFCTDSAPKQAHPHHFAIRRADGFLIGGAGLQLNTGYAQHRAELGYWIARDYRGRGLATSAARAAIQLGFHELGLRRIQATTFVHNVASQRVLTKAGLKREGHLSAYHIKNGVLIDVDLFAILAPGTRSENPSI